MSKMVSKTTSLRIAKIQKFLQRFGKSSEQSRLGSDNIVTYNGGFYHIYANQHTPCIYGKYDYVMDQLQKEWKLRQTKEKQTIAPRIGIPFEYLSGLLADTLKKLGIPPSDLYNHASDLYVGCTDRKQAEILLHAGEWQSMSSIFKPNKGSDMEHYPYAVDISLAAMAYYYEMKRYRQIKWDIKGFFKGSADFEDEIPNQMTASIAMNRRFYNLIIDALDTVEFVRQLTNWCKTKDIEIENYWANDELIFRFTIPKMPSL